MSRPCAKYQTKNGRCIFIGKTEQFNAFLTIQFFASKYLYLFVNDKPNPLFYVGNTKLIVSKHFGQTVNHF